MRISNLFFLSALLCCACAGSDDDDDSTDATLDARIEDADADADADADETDVPEEDSNVEPDTPVCPDLDNDHFQDEKCNPDPKNGGGDCDDTNELINPGRAENCSSSEDYNCNGKIGLEDPDCSRCNDYDDDGYEDINCNPDPKNGGGDCDDRRADVNPGAQEIPGNGRDENCDGCIGITMPDCIDLDYDGYGEGSGCLGPDCDDNNCHIHPWVSEICGDNIDQNCDGDDMICPHNCTDNDHDGYGEGSGCFAMDCNDDNPNINPGAREIADNGIDDDCDGKQLSSVANCIDNDGDGYGVGAGCLGRDCDDSNPLINPGRLELCGNGLDDDCLGGDETCTNPGTGTCVDKDGDGYGTGACPKGGPDCDDSNPAINPGAAETCNGIDDNCNGQTDECPHRNQVCVEGACTGDIGSPCDPELSVFETCAARSGLTCSEAYLQCRVSDGGKCEESSACDKSANCEIVSACDSANKRCYKGRGDDCIEDCDCNDDWLCHPSLHICSECTDDDVCSIVNPTHPHCTASGYCTRLYDQLGGNTDAQKIFFQAIAQCWNDFHTGGAIQGCASLQFSATLRGTNEHGSNDTYEQFEFEEQKALACNSEWTAAVGFSESEIKAIKELFGCGFNDISNLFWPNAIQPENLVCLYFVPNKRGFSFPNNTRNAVVVTDCSSSPIP